MVGACYGEGCCGGHGGGVLWRTWWKRAVTAMADACCGGHGGGAVAAMAVAAMVEACCGGHGSDGTGMLWRP